MPTLSNRLTKIEGMPGSGWKRPPDMDLAQFIEVIADVPVREIACYLEALTHAELHQLVDALKEIETQPKETQHGST